MKKGKMLGKGMTAEVYEWGQDKVLKLYFERFSEDWIIYEARIGTAVHEAGVDSPAVYDIVEVNGRRGIIFQRVHGRSMLRHIKAEPWNMHIYARRLAQLQHRIHQHTADGLPSQAERYAARISGCSEILGDREQKILSYISRLPDGKSVCHGDLHFNNIIVSGSRLVPVDWSNAYLGNPLGDVARTCLIMNSPAKPPINLYLPDAVMIMSQYTKWLTYWAYINEYKKLTAAGSEDIEAWILPTAAAKLRDRIPGEQSWLLNTIDHHLKKICN